MAEALKRVDKDETLKSELWTRMDEDGALYNLEPYVMKDFKNKKVPRVDNVTLPDIRTFADRVLSVTGGAMPQIKIKSKQLDDDGRQNLKNFLYGSLDNANEILSAKQMVPLHNALAWYGAIRGWVADRVVVAIDSQGRLRVDILPIDPRYMWYGIGSRGMRWAAHQTVRDAEEIIDEYTDMLGVNKANLKGLSGDDIKVLDCWDKNENIVYANRKEIFTQDNKFLYVPYNIQPCASKPSDGKTDWRKRFGDSIFAAVRDINTARNKTATILQTLNVNSCMGAYEWIGGGDTPDLPGTGSITDVDERTQGWRLVQLPDVYQATAFSWQIFDSAFQRCTYAHIEYGGIEFPLSSLALGQLKEGRDQILVPLLQALTIVDRDTCKMVIHQFKQGGYSAELGADDVVAIYTAAEIPDSGYNIKFVFKTTVISEAGAAYHMATLAQPFLPKKLILEEHIKVDNAEEIELQKLSDEAGDLIPEIKLLRMGKALEKIGDPDEAEIIKQVLDRALGGEQQPAPAPQQRAIAPRAAPTAREAPTQPPQRVEEVPRA